MKMKQTRSLDLVDPGSLAPPGVIGRGTRLLLGLLCLNGVWAVLNMHQSILFHPATTLSHLILLLIGPAWVLNYVVNIGFSRSWGHKPLYFTVALLFVGAISGQLLEGSADSPWLGIPLLVMLLYFYLHLGISFVLSALLATPGCEMRSIPQLMSKLTGNPSPEHHCPAGFLTALDRWELSRRSGNREPRS